MFEPRPQRMGTGIEEEEEREEDVWVRMLDRQSRVRTGWSVATMDTYIRGVGGLERMGVD